jgi:hypothetical protein
MLQALVIVTTLENGKEATQVISNQPTHIPEPPLCLSKKQWDKW